MAKYHINPTTGDPGVCKATKSCPFGDLQEDHYKTQDEARAVFELKMKYGDFKPLFQVLDLEGLNKDIHDGFIDVRSHEDDEALKVMCYSKQTQFAGHWTEATKVARGLIVRADKEDFSDAVIVERPWRKFFTLDQLSTGDWVLGDEEREGKSVEAELAKIDFNASVEVTDKVDGSMGVLYRAPDGKPALSTKGSFGSDQAKYYTSMLRNTELGEQAEDLLAKDRDNTFLFELVGRNNRIVLDYPDDQIIMLGVVNKKTGQYISANGYEDRWAGGMTETMPANTVAEALALPVRPNREGVVIRILSEDPKKQMQLKVKQDDYKTLHRAVTGFSVSDMRTAIRDSGESINELVEVANSKDVTKLKGVRDQLTLLETHPLLSDVKEERQKAFEKAIMPRLESMVKAKQTVDALPASFFEQENPAKAFALSIANEDSSRKRDLFSFFQARNQGRALGEMSGENILKSISGDVKADLIKKWGDE